MTQIDFLDQLGRELDGAAGRVIRGRRRSRMRALLVPAAALAIAAGIAVAVWPSAPADPEREVAAPAETRSLEQMLGVLRRPESAADRAAAREARELGILSGDGVHRVLGEGTDGKPIMLDSRDGVRRPAGGTARAAVCVHYPDVDGAGVGCWTRGDVAEGRAYGSLGKHLFGLAPDGVVAVWVDAVDDSRRLAVEDNFFRFDGISMPEVVSIAYEDADGKRTLRHVPGLPRVGPVPVPEESMRAAVALARAEVVPARKGLPVAEELATLREIEKRVPLPPVDADELHPVARSGRGASIVSAEAMIEARAACLWMRYWLATVNAGDDKVAGQAAQVLQTVPGWPALRETTGDYARVAFAARNGDAGNVARHVARRCR